MIQKCILPDLTPARSQNFCYGEITQELSNGLILQMHYLNQQDTQKPIMLYINSADGDAAARMDVYDAIIA